VKALVNPIRGRKRQYLLAIMALTAAGVPQRRGPARPRSADREERHSREQRAVPRPPSACTELGELLAAGSPHTGCLGLYLPEKSR